MSVIITGGGMAGATLALAISRLTGGQLPVHLVESRTPGADVHPGFDARAIALSSGTCQHLARLGIWPALADCVTPITRVHVSDRGHAGGTTIDTRDYDIAALGNVIELHEAGLRLFGLLHKAPGVTLHCPASVTGVERTVDQAQVTLDNGATLHGQLLVAADGTRSSLAAHCGIGWQQRDYQQIAVIANVATALPHEGRAWERFTRHGPLAILPMSGKRCSLVWCFPASRQEEITQWSDARFCHELQQAFGWRLGQITHSGVRHCYPLALTRADRCVTHRLALVGNAAQTLHPIAGQGFNLGIRDVVTLAEMLARAWHDGEDPGSCAVLSAYQARRAEDKAATIGVTDGLVSLFANHWFPLVAGRNLGLMAMDVFSPARDALAYRTLGWVAR